jgi:hypothetical protein
MTDSKEPDLRRKTKTKTNCLLYFFLCFAGHCRQGREEEKKLSQTHLVSWIFTAAHEPTRNHYSYAQKPSSTLFLQIPEGFGFFGVYFVILLKCV